MYLGVLHRPTVPNNVGLFQQSPFALLCVCVFYLAGCIEGLSVCFSVSSLSLDRPCLSRHSTYVLSFYFLHWYSAVWALVPDAF